MRILIPDVFTGVHMDDVHIDKEVNVRRLAAGTSRKLLS